MSKDAKKKHHWGSSLLSSIGLKRKHKKEHSSSSDAKRSEKDYARTTNGNGSGGRAEAARFMSENGGNPDIQRRPIPEMFTDSPAKGSQKADSSLAPSQGVFNIPIVIDPMETNRLNKTNTSLTLGSLKGHYPNENQNPE